MSIFVKKDTGKMVLDAVIESLNRAALYNRDVQVAPAAMTEREYPAPIIPTRCLNIRHSRMRPVLFGMWPFQGIS
jgi:hypothetical protein